MQQETSALSEVEIKIELESAAEVAKIKNLLLRSGISFTSKNQLQEYYITKQASPYGGWDFERLRQVGDSTYLRTVKKWVTDKDSHVIRLEDEKNISKQEFESIIGNGFVLHYSKVREDFKGHINAKKCTISIDTLEFKNTNHFYLECEVISPQQEAHATREMIEEWMKSELNITKIKEAPSMIDIVTSIAKNA